MILLILILLFSDSGFYVEGSVCVSLFMCVCVCNC